MLWVSLMMLHVYKLWRLLEVTWKLLWKYCIQSRRYRFYFKLHSSEDCNYTILYIIHVAFYNYSRHDYFGLWNVTVQ